MKTFRIHLLFFLLVACGGKAETIEDTATNLDTAAPQIDAGPDEEPPQDEGSPLEDEGIEVDEGESPADVQVIDAPALEDTGPLINGYLETVFGVIDGACGLMGPEITSPEPSFFKSTYTFRDDFSFNIEEFSEGPQNRFAAGNAGGSSGCSEIISMQLLVDCQNAVVLKTENEILYQTEGKETDFLVSIEGQPVGVSVSRAYKGPFTTTYSVADATNLLEKKLEGVNESSLNVHPDDAWVKQILIIWTLHPDWADKVETAWLALGPELKADTILLVTVEQNSDMFVHDTCTD